MILSAASIKAASSGRTALSDLLVHRFDEIDHMGGIHFCWDDL
jgi:hypothetical protein